MIWSAARYLLCSRMFTICAWPMARPQSKLRWLMLCGSVLMHTGIGLIMGLSTFSLFMLCLALAFVPAQTHHAFVNLLSHRGVSIEEIARLAGHASTRTTEIVYRRELRPVITTGAEIMDELFSGT